MLDYVAVTEPQRAGERPLSGARLGERPLSGARRRRTGAPLAAVATPRPSSAGLAARPSSAKSSARSGSSGGRRGAYFDQQQICERTDEISAELFDVVERNFGGGVGERMREVVEDDGGGGGESDRDSAGGNVEVEEVANLDMAEVQAVGYQEMADRRRREAERRRKGDRKRRKVESDSDSSDFVEAKTARIAVARPKSAAKTKPKPKSKPSQKQKKKSAQSPTGSAYVFHAGDDEGFVPKEHTPPAGRKRLEIVLPSRASTPVGRGQKSRAFAADRARENDGDISGELFVVGGPDQHVPAVAVSTPPESPVFVPSPPESPVIRPSPAVAPRVATRESDYSDVEDSDSDDSNARERAEEAEAAATAAAPVAAAVVKPKRERPISLLPEDGEGSDHIADAQRRARSVDHSDSSADDDALMQPLLTSASRVASDPPRRTAASSGAGKRSRAATDPPPAKRWPLSPDTHSRRGKAPTAFISLDSDNESEHCPTPTPSRSWTPASVLKVTSLSSPERATNGSGYRAASGGHSSRRRKKVKPLFSDSDDDDMPVQALWMPEEERGRQRGGEAARGQDGDEVTPVIVKKRGPQAVDSDGQMETGRQEEWMNEREIAEFSDSDRESAPVVSLLPQRSHVTPGPRTFSQFSLSPVQRRNVRDPPASKKQRPAKAKAPLISSPRSGFEHKTQSRAPSGSRPAQNAAARKALSKESRRPSPENISARLLPDRSCQGEQGDDSVVELSCEDSAEGGSNSGILNNSDDSDYDIPLVLGRDRGKQKVGASRRHASAAAAADVYSLSSGEEDPSGSESVARSDDDAVIDLDDEDEDISMPQLPPFDIKLLLCVGEESVLEMFDRRGEDEVMQLIFDARDAGRRIINGDAVGIPSEPEPVAKRKISAEEFDEMYGGAKRKRKKSRSVEMALKEGEGATERYRKKYEKRGKSGGGQGKSRSRRGGGRSRGRGRGRSRV